LTGTGDSSSTSGLDPGSTIRPGHAPGRFSFGTNGISYNASSAVAIADGQDIYDIDFTNPDSPIFDMTE